MTPEEEAGLRAEMERLCAENVRLRAQMAEKDAYLVEALARRRSSARQPLRFQIVGRPAHGL